MSAVASIADAVRSLRPNAVWVVGDNTYGSLQWNDLVQTKPTEQEINDEIDRLNQTFNYKEDRSKKYPPMEEQLDMLWHAMEKGVLPKVDDFYNALLLVKSEYPKPQPLNVIVYDENVTEINSNTVFTVVQNPAL